VSWFSPAAGTAGRGEWGWVREGRGAACARCVETAGTFRRAVIGVRMLQCFVLSLWGVAQAVSLPRTFCENIPYVEVSM
jgi:hypothetical protein